MYIDESNMLNVWFRMNGPSDSPFEGGQYIGCFELDPEYPMKPPEIKIHTPNGRYTAGERLCFSFTARYNNSTFHAKDRAEVGWLPTNTLHSMILAVISAMEERGSKADQGHGEGAGGHLYHTPDAEIRRLAGESRDFNVRRFSFHEHFEMEPTASDGALTAGEAAGNTAAATVTRDLVAPTYDVDADYEYEDYSEPEEEAADEAQ
jgi:ubiquitin-protein ligase